MGTVMIIVGAILVVALGWLVYQANKVVRDLNNSIDKIFVAERNSRAVAHCFWDFYEDEPYIYSIYVSKAHRRKGVAAKLLALAEDDIQKNKLKICKLSTRINNPAKEFFEKSGYQFLGREKDWLRFEKELNQIDC